MAIQVALIGAGAVASLHVEAVRKLEGVEVIAVAERDVEVAEKRAAQLHILHAYDDYRPILANPEIVAVHICVPNHLHMEVIEATFGQKNHWD
jgi:predicted dehydrogenase